MKQAKILLTITQPCLNHEFPREELKNYHVRKIFVFLRGPMTWKVMPRNVWSDIAGWRTKQLKSFSKLQINALMTINPKNKNNWDLLENCQKYALKLS